MAELSAKDMQAQLDFVVRKFQENMKSFDEVKAQMAKALSSLANFPKVEDLVEIQGKFNESLAKMSKNSQDAQVNQQNQLVNLKEAINSANQRIDNALKSHEELKSASIVMEGKFADILHSLRNFCQIKDYVDLKERMATQEANLFKFNADCKDVINSLRQQIDRHDAKFSDQEARLLSLRKDHEGLSSIAFALQAKLDAAKSEHAKDISNVKQSLMDHVYNSLAAIPKPAQSISLDDAKNAMQSKLEPMALDAKNANLRAVNNESKITILEKKVEQLQLLLNKFQLQG